MFTFFDIGTGNRQLSLIYWLNERSFSYLCGLSRTLFSYISGVDFIAISFLHKYFIRIVGWDISFPYFESFFSVIIILVQFFSAYISHFQYEQTYLENQNKIDPKISWFNSEYRSCISKIWRICCGSWVTRWFFLAFHLLNVLDNEYHL